MKPSYLIHGIKIVLIALCVTACVPELTVRESRQKMPVQYPENEAATNFSNKAWPAFFDDPYLIALIDSALMNNQELHIFMQELATLKNDVQARKGEYLPIVGLGTGAAVDKVGRYSRLGALEANNDIRPGKGFPDPLPDFAIGAYASWEVDLWKKLRKAKKSALIRYLASVEGQHFLVTNLVAELASAYYDLLTLDRQLAIVQQNIEIQRNALEVVKVQKQSAKVTELAVKRFEAQLDGTQSLQFDLQQQIVEVENEINFLVGRFPQQVARSGISFDSIRPDTLAIGRPAQLLDNRPDIREAELRLSATKLDVEVAKANFYPSLALRGGLGVQAFDPGLLLKTPASLMYGLSGELLAPLVNRKGIEAVYRNANARQIQAAVAYEQTILHAYIEVVNQVSNIRNLDQSYSYRQKQVQRLNESIDISGILFRSARADYVEVLLTQEEALESRFELAETKRQQLIARVDLYRALGGGWK